MELLNDSGKLYLVNTLLRGQFVLRFAVGCTRTESKHVSAAWELIQASIAPAKAAVEEAAASGGEKEE
jgi:hypothetical protein